MAEKTRRRPGVLPERRRSRLAVTPSRWPVTSSSPSASSSSPARMPTRLGTGYAAWLANPRSVPGCSSTSLPSCRPSGQDRTESQINPPRHHLVRLPPSAKTPGRALPHPTALTPARGRDFTQVSDRELGLDRSTGGTGMRCSTMLSPCRVSEWTKSPSTTYAD
jgi:hypothetical protein